MKNKIKKSLDQYLEFDSDELFWYTNREIINFNLVRIFGGAIRDIIADQPIHDVDILIGTKAHGYIESVLKNNGYHYMEMINGKDLQVMYSEIHVINEPHTWIKGNKIVQLIRPSIGVAGKSSEAYHTGFNDLIANVDISCCGVSYDGNRLIEDYLNAILHCQNKVFSVNERAKMYSTNRIHHRTGKLVDRGWKQVSNTTEVNRDLKLDLVL